MTELMFADDAAAIGSDRVSMECAAAELERVIKDWGLTLKCGEDQVTCCRDSRYRG